MPHGLAHVKMAKQSAITTQAAVSGPQLDVAHAAQLTADEEIERVPPVLTAPPIVVVPPVPDVPTPPLPPVPVAGLESLLPQATIEVARKTEIPRVLNVSMCPPMSESYAWQTGLRPQSGDVNLIRLACIPPSPSLVDSRTCTFRSHCPVRETSS